MDMGLVNMVTIQIDWAFIILDDPVIDLRTKQDQRDQVSPPENRLKINMKSDSIIEINHFD